MGCVRTHKLGGQHTINTHKYFPIYAMTIPIDRAATELCDKANYSRIPAAGNIIVV